MGFSSSRSSSSSHRGGNLVSIGRNYESIAENRRGSNSVWVKLTNGILVEEEEEEEEEEREGEGGGGIVSLPPSSDSQ